MQDLDPRALYVVVGVLAFFVVLLALVVSHDYRRRRGLVALAGEKGLTFRREARELLERLEGFQLLPVGSNRRITNVLEGEVGAARLWFFDYSCFVGGKNASRREHSVCAVRSPDLKLPYFYLRPEVPGIDRLGPLMAKHLKGEGRDPLSLALGAHDIDFPEDAEFSKRVVVQGKDEEAIRPLFDVEVRQLILRSTQTLDTLEGEGDTLLLSPGRPALPSTARAVLEHATALLTMMSRRTGHW